MSDASNDVETYIEAAFLHGADSEPEHEVGDLQSMLRIAWSIMTDEQRVIFSQSDEVREIVTEHAEGCIDCLAVPGTSHYGTVGDGFDGRCPSCADKAEEDGTVEIG